MMARVFAKGLALALWCGISSHATPEVKLSSCIPHMGSAALAAGSGLVWLMPSERKFLACFVFWHSPLWTDLYPDRLYS